MLELVQVCYIALILSGLSMIGSCLFLKHIPEGYSSLDSPPLGSEAISNTMRSLYAGILFIEVIRITSSLFLLPFEWIILPRLVLFMVYSIFFWKLLYQSVKGHSLSFLILTLLLAGDATEFDSQNSWTALHFVPKLILVLLNSQFRATEIIDVDSSEETGATVYSRITMSWLNSLIALGAKHPLVQSDVWQPYHTDSSFYIVPEWEKIKSGKIIRDLIRLNLDYFVLHYFLAIIMSFLTFVGIFKLNQGHSSCTC
jgi:hypothetical protein